MQTKGNDSRRSDKDLQTPSVFIFSVLVGDQKTTPPAVSTLFVVAVLKNIASNLQGCTTKTSSSAQVQVWKAFIFMGEIVQDVFYMF